MTAEEAAEILGPEVTAKIHAQAVADGPLSQQQIDLLVRILAPRQVVEVPASRDVA